MTQHVRTDQEQSNSKRKFACGLGPDLPKGDTWVYPSETGHGYGHIDCVGCGGGPRKPLGTPMSEVSGRVVPWDHPDYPKYVEFCRIARSWGHE